MAPPVVVTGKAGAQISPAIALSNIQAVPDEDQNVLCAHQGCTRHEEENCLLLGAQKPHLPLQPGGLVVSNR